MPTNPYHIAHVLPWPFVGGTEQATLRIVQALEGGHFRSTVFCPGESSPARALFADQGVPTVAYEPVYASLRRPHHFLRASARLAREFRRQNVDLVHCADMLSGLYAGLAGKLARVPVLCHIRCCFETIPRRERGLLYAVDKFAFVSHEAWRRFGLRVAPGRGTVIYDGVEVEADDAGEAASSVRREFGIRGDEKIIGMVARVTPAKDYATLIRAAARVVAAGPRVRFLIIGDYAGPEINRRQYEEVRRMLGEAGLTPHFIFTGHRADVGRLVRALDISVLVTHTEGLPLVLLEAMARARPVIATAVGGVPEVVTDGQNGLLHEHEDDATLARHILDLLGDPARAAALGAAGRRFVSANFTTSKFAAGVSGLYREMLAGRAPHLLECHNA